MPAIAGMFLVSEEGLVNPDCCRSTRFQRLGYRSSRFQPRLSATLRSFSLRFPFRWTPLCLTLGLLLGFLLHLALGLLLDLTLGFLFSLLLGFSLSCFFLRLALSSFLLGLTLCCFFLRSAALSDLSLRFLTRYFTLLRDFALRSFFTRLLFGSHKFLRVGYPALSIYNGTEKSSKSSDVVNIFAIVFFGQIPGQKDRNSSFVTGLFFTQAKSVANLRKRSLQMAESLSCLDTHKRRRVRFKANFANQRASRIIAVSFPESLLLVSSMTRKTRISQGFGAILSTR